MFGVPGQRHIQAIAVEQGKQLGIAGNPDLAGGGLMVAGIQLAIIFGATVGGLLYDGVGYQATFIASGVFLLIAAVLALLVSRTAMPVAR
uniref:hypothetical protein n=1 Tax=Pseudomonas sp. G.S.17 TaxID=3137451 RepID=UPI0040549E5A